MPDLLRHAAIQYLVQSVRMAYLGYRRRVPPGHNPRIPGLKCGRSCRCGGGIFRGWRVGDARPSILAPNRSYPLPPLFPLFPIMILTKTRISLGLPPPNPAYHLAWVHRAVYPLAWDPQTPHIPWLGIPKPRISLGLGFPKPEYPLAWDSQNPHIPWLRFSLFSRFSFFAQIGIAAPLVEPAPQRRLPHTQLRSHFNPSSLTSLSQLSLSGGPTRAGQQPQAANGRGGTGVPVSRFWCWRVVVWC